MGEDPGMEITYSLRLHNPPLPLVLLSPHRVFSVEFGRTAFPTLSLEFTLVINCQSVTQRYPEVVCWLILYTKVM